ncbi:beta strand repeat-containing protein [Verrucomicrobiota bacterium sgz303538]
MIPLSRLSAIKSKRPLILAASCALLLARFGAEPARADLNWDIIPNNNAIDGGSGIWNAALLNWSTDGVTNVVWNSTGAIFGGPTGGLVTIGGGTGVSSSGLTFNPTGDLSTYSIVGETLSDTLKLTGTATITANQDAAINAIIAGNAGFNKAGLGTLILGGANTFTGGAIFKEGTVKISSDANLGNASNVLTLDGGTLDLSAAVNSVRAVSLGVGINTVTFETGNSVWTGQITGSGGFTKNGAGTLELAGNVGNTFAGQLTINNGTLFLNKANGSAIGEGGLNIASDSLPGFGSATVTLRASEQIADNAPIVIDAKNSVTGGPANRAALDLNGFTETVGAISMATTTAGSAVIRLGATGKLILNGDLTLDHNRGATGNTGREILITGTGNLNTAGVGGTLDLGGVARTITVNSNHTQANGDATIEAVITNGSLIKAGARVLRLGAVNTYTGSTTINNGTLRIMVDGALPANTPLTINGSDFGATATLDLNGFNFTLTAANNLKLGGGFGASSITTGTGTLTLATDIAFDATNDPTGSTISGRLDIGGPSRTFNVGDSQFAAADMAISATILGTGNIVKTGGGALALRAQNTGWTGNVLVNQGTLRLDTALSDSTQFNNIFGAASNGVTLDGTTLQLAYTSDRTLTGRVFTIGTGGATIDTGGGYFNFVESGITQIRLAAGTQTTIFTGTAGITKTGGGRLTLNSSSPNFSGPWTINDGTIESSGAAMGNASATNTITINGGNWSLTADTSQPLITLNGGALSATGANRTVNGKIDVTAQSYVFLNDFWRDYDSANRAGSNLGRTITHTGVLTGDDPLGIAVNRFAYEWNNGAFVLKNPANTYSGEITVGKNLTLESNPTGGTGKTIGAASIVLQGGHLRLRDNGTGSGGVLAYGNNVSVTDPFDLFDRGTLAGTAAIDVNRVSGNNIGNTIRLGTLSIGAQTLDVLGGNGYKVEFTGLTTFTGSPTLNVSAATLTFAGGLSASGQTLIKNGPGTLRLLGNVALDGYTLNGGTIELPNQPSGTGRTLALPTGTGFAAGYVATQANLIDRVTLDSAGVVALGVDSTFNPDFTGFTGALRLGGSANATLTGTITPAGNTYLLGGAGGTLTLASANALSGARSLNVGTNGTTAGTIVLANTNGYTGATTVTDGMILRAGSNASLGTNPSITLDNATLQLASGGDFTSFGTARTITVGVGGATLDTGSNNVTLANALNGSGIFTKAGAGALTLGAVNSAFGGKTIINEGTIVLGADDHLGAAPTAGAVADQLQLGGGTLKVSADVTLAANRGITLVGDGGTIDTGTSAVAVVGKITGAGPLTKVGGGVLTLNADNSYTGATTVAAGVLELGASANVDSNITINSGATLRTLGGTNAISDGQTVTVNTGGTYDIRASDTIARLVGDGLVTKGTTGAITLTLSSTTNASFGGVIENGSGTIGISKGGANTLIFTGTNTYTGNTAIGTGQIRVEGANARLSGGGTISIGDNNGNDESLVLGAATDVVTGTLDHVADSSQIEFRGSTPLTINGPALASSGFTETMGDLDFREGTGQLNLVPVTGGQIQLNANSLTRENNNATGVIRGTNLGGTGANSSRVVFTNAPTLVGSGGTGSQASIIPFLIGGNSATAAPNTFLRYDSVNGVTPLANSDYAAQIAGGTGRNISTAGGETVAGTASINALRVTGGATMLNGGVLTIDSGAILFTGANGSIGGSSTINFGARQGVIHVSNDGTAITGAVNANITAAAGLAIGEAGNVANVIELGGTNRIAGGVFLNSGTTRLTSSGALGVDTFNDLVLRPQAVLQLNGNNASVVFGGNDRLQGSTNIQNGSANPATLTIFTNVNSAGNDGTITDGGAGALSFVKRGTATLSLEQNNSYTGVTELVSGIIQLRGGGGRISTSSAYNLRSGTFQLTYEGSGNNATDRISNTAPITMYGATLHFDGNATSGQNYAENAGPLIIASGGNTVLADQAASGNTSNIAFDSLQRTGAGAVVNFTGTGLGVDTRNRVSFDVTAPTLDDGIIGGWAFLNGADFATYGDLGSGNTSVLALATYDAGPATGWTAASNARPTANVALGASATVNSLNLTDGINLDLGASKLTIDTGGLIAAGATAKTISNGTITAGTVANADLIIRTEGTGSVTTVDAVIDDNAAGSVGLTKTGVGRLVLSRANGYSGRTVITQGSIAISDDANLGDVPTSATAGNIHLAGGSLEITAPITLNANRGIQVSGSGGAVDVRGSDNVFTYNGAITAVGAAGITFTGERTASGSTANIAEASVALSAPVDMDGDFSFNVDGALALNGNKNRIGGTFQFGANQSNAYATYGVAGGSLSLGGINPNGTDVNIGFRSIDSGATSTLTKGTLDLSGSQDLTIKANNVNLGVITGAGGAGGAEGHLIIGTNSTIIAANQILLSNSVNSGNDTPLPSEIVFGSGINTVTTPTFTVGGQKGDGSIRIAPGGTLNLSGYASGSADLFIARNNLGGTGTISQGAADLTGGTLIADLDELVIGHKSGTGGTITGGANGFLTTGTGAHVVKANSIRVGERLGDATGNTSGTFNLDGGTFTVVGDLSAGLSNGTGATGTVSGTVNVSGGSLSVGGNVVLANRVSAGTANGTLNLFGGATTVGGNITTSNDTEANSSVALIGGTLDMTGGTINVDNFTVESGTLRNVAQIQNGDGATPTGLTKTSPGTLVLGGTNTYTGPTEVVEGTVLLSGTLSGTSAVNVAPGATLGGAGSINAPLAFGNNSKLSIELGGLNPGEDLGKYDQLNMTSATGSVSLGSNVVLSLLLGFQPNVSTDTFYFILTRADNGTSYGNTFAGLAEGAQIDLGNGFLGRITYHANWTGDQATSSFTGGNDIAISIPEPSSVIALFSGLGAMLGLPRFRRSRRA